MQRNQNFNRSRPRRRPRRAQGYLARSMHPPTTSLSYRGSVNEMRLVDSKNAYCAWFHTALTATSVSSGGGVFDQNFPAYPTSALYVDWANAILFWTQFRVLAMNLRLWRTTQNIFNPSILIIGTDRSSTVTVTTSGAAADLDNPKYFCLPLNQTRPALYSAKYQNDEFTESGWQSAVATPTTGPFTIVASGTGTATTADYYYIASLYIQLRSRV